jgi:hypothetical protein
MGGCYWGIPTILISKTYNHTVRIELRDINNDEQESGYYLFSTSLLWWWKGWVVAGHALVEFRVQITVPAFWNSTITDIRDSAAMPSCVYKKIKRELFAA